MLSKNRAEPMQRICFYRCHSRKILCIRLEHLLLRLLIWSRTDIQWSSQIDLGTHLIDSRDVLANIHAVTGLAPDCNEDRHRKTQDPCKNKWCDIQSFLVGRFHNKTFWTITLTGFLVLFSPGHRAHTELSTFYGLYIEELKGTPFEYFIVL